MFSCLTMQSVFGKDHGHKNSKSTFFKKGLEYDFYYDFIIRRVHSPCSFPRRGF